MRASRYKDALSEIALILDALRSSGVDAIPLKGAVGALSLLGDEGLYAGSDIDLPVRRESLEGGEVIASGRQTAPGRLIVAAARALQL